MSMSMWWSHIPNIDLYPVIRGREIDPPNPNPQIPDPSAVGGAGTGTPPAGQAGSGDGTEGDPQKKIAALIEEKDRHWTDAQEAKRKLEELSPELEELRKFKEKADTDKLTNEQRVQKEIDDLKTLVAQKDQIIDSLKNGQKKLAIQNAFLQHEEVKWHKPERALALADLSAIEIDEKDGVATVKNPDALTKAIKDLAESDPYLVVNPDTPPSWKGKTGDPATPKAPKSEAARVDELKGKYPALRR